MGKKKFLKKAFPLILSGLFLMCAVGCSGNAGKDQAGNSTDSGKDQEMVTSGEADDSNSDDAASGGSETGEEESVSSNKNTIGGNSRILVAYFSATGTTRKAAEYIAEITGADLFEIIPTEPYSTDDLDYNDDSSRANKEQEDEKARPEIAEAIPNMDHYDVVFIGHPIWWGIEPRIMDTFMESYDLSGKTLIPFCTSGSTGITRAEENLKAMAEDARWLDGKRFGAGVTKEDISAWIDTLAYQETEVIGMEGTKLGIQVGDTVMTAVFEDNSSAKALIEELKKGSITIEMEDYSNFEKVGPLGVDLPRNDKQITTEPGDVILYLGNQLTIYYDTNSWNFTMLAKIEELTQKELKEILGDGDVTVTLFLQ